MSDFEDYMTTVVTTGRLARPTAFGPTFGDHAQALAEQLLKSFSERLDAFTAYDRYVDCARALGVETRDLQLEMQQVRAGLNAAVPDAVFSPDLMRESIAMLEQNTSVRDVIERTVQLQRRSEAVYESRKQLDHAQDAVTPPAPSRADQTRDRGTGGPEPEQGRRL